MPFNYETRALAKRCKDGVFAEIVSNRYLQVLADDRLAQKWPILAVMHSHTNSLIHAKSPYLLQHAHNPVDWREWNDETIALAREQNLPVFLSIGYSTCHWCHVMERESFENEAVAQLMNDNFIPIKLDREERPDIDHIYMKFVQATNNGQGGWPMSVFLTPELKPFYGGTYFPPQDGYGRPGFSTLLRSISHAWQNDQSGIQSASENATKFLQSTSQMEPAPDETDWNQVFSDSYAQFRAQFDEKLGGFGEAPKFPRPVVHDFLHRLWFFTREQPALQMSQFTLDAMGKGGMRDHLGGGFHRYSVDAQWIVSHFEKMLYDQAQLVISLLEIGQISKETRFFDVARQTLDYVLHDMTHEGGGFFAGEDADSLPDENSSHKEEGAFYVWTQAEIESALGENASLFNAFYNVKPNGNAPREGDPHGEFKGKNILFTTRPLFQVAPQVSLGEIEAVKRLENSRPTLLEIRNRRPRPHRDDKIIVAWNGLMISAFSQAGAILGEHKYLQVAARAAQFIRDELWNAQSQTLKRHFKDGAANVSAFADDYAALTRGLLDLTEASGEIMWLQWAQEVSASMVNQFWDNQNGAYFNAPADPNVLVRSKEDYDGAEPSANGLAAQNDARLSELCEGEAAAAPRERLRQTLHAFSARLQTFPSAMPLLETAAMRELAPPLHIVIVGEAQSDDTRALLQAVHDEFLPFKSLIHLNQTNREFWNTQLPFTSAMTMIDSRATAYVCHNFACRQPVNSPEALRNELANAQVG